MGTTLFVYNQEAFLCDASNFFQFKKMITWYVSFLLDHRHLKNLRTKKSKKFKIIYNSTAQRLIFQFVSF